MKDSNKLYLTLLIVGVVTSIVLMRQNYGNQEKIDQKNSQKVEEPNSISTSETTAKSDKSHSITTQQSNANSYSRHPSQT